MTGFSPRVPEKADVKHLIVGLSLVVSAGAQGATLYGIGNFPTGSSTLYRIDNYATAPAATPIGSGTLGLAGDIAVDPTTGIAYFTRTSGGLFTVDLDTGNVTAAIGASAGINPNALTFSADGTLYSWGGRDQQGFMDTNLYVLDKVNGGGSAVLDTGHVAGGDLAYDPALDVLFGSTSDGDLIRIDLNAMSVTTVGTMVDFGGGLLNALGLDIDSHDGTLYALLGGTFSAAATLYTVDKDTAGITLVGDIDGADGVYGGWGLAFGPDGSAPVPGDADGDGDVDAFDLGFWQAQFGRTGGGLEADFDRDGDVDGFDLGLWQTNFGTGRSAAVPEPATAGTVLVAAGMLTGPRRARRA